MKISGQVAKKKLQREALRALSLGTCSGVFAFTHTYTSATTEQVQITCGIAVLLILLAAVVFIYSRLKNFPTETVVLEPHLSLPKSLVNGGLNCAVEPVDFWMWDPVRRTTILMGTAQRQLRLSRGCLSASQWQRLISALPVDRNVPLPRIKDSFSPALVVYAAFLFVIHFLLEPPTALQGFNYLAHGGYNATMSGQAELYRILSYSWVHGNTTHLWANLVALVFIAQALGKSYSSATLVSVIIVSAIISGVIGNLTKDFNVVVGASGAIMGMFGFFFAAQKAKDQRLNPLARIAHQKTLYVLLFVEVMLSLRYSWYGGTIHLVGIATGYGTYKLLAGCAITNRSQARVRFAINALGLVLFLSWVGNTYQLVQHPKKLVEGALATKSPFLVFLASTALPDLPSATHSEILAAREQAIEILNNNTLLSWTLARTDYWLGNSKAALTRLRAYSAAEADSAEVRELWLATERVLAAGIESGQPLRTLPKGPATAYLISTGLDHFARIKLPESQSTVAAALQSREKIDWHLLAVTAPLLEPKMGAYGAWRIPSRKFRTANSVKLAESRLQ